MSIYKTNVNQSPSTRAGLINDMVIELNGKISKAQFDKNELDHLYGLIIQSRRFLRNQSLGHTLATYTGWTHVKAEDGYSIWKYSPTNYAYNALNELYFDDRIVTNKGEALSESASAFDNVFLYNGDSGSGFINNTTEAGTEVGTEFDLMNSTTDYLYVGLSTTYAGIKFEFKTRGANYTLKTEYYNAASGSGWTQLDADINILDDDTSNFASDAAISWTIPDDWTTTTVNSVSSKYWIRISTTTTPVTTAQAYYVIPANSVPSLLALSSSQVLNEEWAWCTYGTSVYVTLRNSGATTAEGNFFITSASSTANKQNYFIYNHELSANYLNSTYDTVVTKTASYPMTSTDGIILADTTSASVTITLPTAGSVEGKEYVIKCIALPSGRTCTVQCQSGQTIDGVSSFGFSAENDFIGVVSDGTNWRIIRRD